MIKLRLLRLGVVLDNLEEPSVMTTVLVREVEGDQVTKRRQCEDRSRDWSDMATSQRMSENVKSWKTNLTYSPLGLPEGASSANIFILAT